MRTEGCYSQRDYFPAIGLALRRRALLHVQNLKGDVMWMALHSSIRFQKEIFLLLYDQLGSRQVRVSLCWLNRRGMKPLSQNSSPISKVSPYLSSLFACWMALIVSSSVILSFFLAASVLSWMRLLGVPANSSTKSMTLPRVIASYREQQLAYAFSSKKGQISTGPSSGTLRERKAGRGDGFFMTGTQSSMMMYFQTLSWYILRRQMPKGLRDCPSKILSNSFGHPERQLMADTRYSCAQLSALLVISTLCGPTRVRLLPLKSSGSRIHWISYPSFSLPFLAAKMDEGTGGNIQSLYLHALGTVCLGQFWYVAAENLLVRVGPVWLSAWSRPMMERYFCLMILFVLFSFQCLQALPLPEATEHDRDLSFDDIKLPLRIVRPFFRMEGLRNFYFLRSGGSGLPSMTPPNLTSFGISGHSECLLSSVLISSSPFYRYHSERKGALSTAVVLYSSLMFLCSCWCVLSIFIPLEESLGRGQQSLLITFSAPSSSSLGRLLCAFLRCNLQLRLEGLPLESSLLRQSLLKGAGLSAVWTKGG